ncbi:hypothetical protein [Acidiferrobacter sp.]|jgi:hypothetical protein|uniref:hypothetical protein n=1 Tax=Acidiferrobacter sp. TaxID=1872107 RepID=UPI00260D0D0A|nr:hypothetical protein [Acidiferrobacter sp.]
MSHIKQNGGCVPFRFRSRFVMLYMIFQGDHPEPATVKGETDPALRPACTRLYGFWFGHEFLLS